MSGLIPLPYRILAMVLAVAALAGASAWKGAQWERAKWEAKAVEAERAIAALQQRQAAVTTETITKYVDRVKIVRETGDTIIKEVLRYVPSNTCALPGGFRVLHDAAAAGAVPDSAGIADAPAVDAQSAATTVADNYTTCHVTEARLVALQAWITNQRGE